MSKGNGGKGGIAKYSLTVVTSDHVEVYFVVVGKGDDRSLRNSQKGINTRSNQDLPSRIVKIKIERRRVGRVDKGKWHCLIILFFSSFAEYSVYRRNGMIKRRMIKTSENTKARKDEEKTSSRHVQRRTFKGKTQPQSHQ